MNILISLWLPILLSAVVVFVISALVHMVIKWHSFDYKGFENEDAVRTALGANNVPGIKYVVPFCADMKEMGGDAMQKKYLEGPNAVIVFGPNARPSMGKSLGLWFVWCLVVAVAVGFLTSQMVAVGHVHALRAAKLAGAITLVAYGFGTFTESIWMYRSWRATATYVADALLYALGTAAVFYWFWK